MRNFFPPLILLESIHEACSRRADPPAAEAPPNPNQRAEGRFQTFVNKLAHICDYRPKGETVTALAVLVDEGGRVLYLFASNRRARANLNKTKQDLIVTLNILRENLNPATRVSDTVLNDRLLRQVLAVNTVRIQGYLSRLSKELKPCIKACESQSSQPDYQDAAQRLERLFQAIPDTKQAGQKSDEFVTATIQCIQIIQEYRQLPVQHFIERRAYSSEQLGNAPFWSNLQHVIGRLLSYQYDVETLISAHHIWGDTELFRDFDVDFLDSSDPYPASVTRITAETVDSILRRTPQVSTAQLDILKQHARDLQKYDLDGRLERQWKRKIEPIVHAEVLLHDWLSRTPGGVQEARFFSNWRYIGTSKPICRLCQYYFAIIATAVRFRDGHPNTYLNWRPPDIRLPEGSDDVEQERAIWCRVIDQMKIRVYADMRRLLAEKKTDKKYNDSNTNTDRITLDGLNLTL
ncbi:hypothetical protein QBC34DRAFT_295800 [Podospora aff. communis PSN243]|uniref:Uncharacterized protein n=1 Tax=Podospora aff. communis PSN243 TaxID=3040156 RepID=A0AAV9GTE7_9PEZI|nr:hypothetical protein QBC34DRAFT_295800 [Podospora aff. communis PSN243]